MAVIKVDVNEPEPWRGGLLSMVARTASAEVIVEGLADPVSGELVQLTNDELMITAPDGDDTNGGSITVVSMTRVIAVKALWEFVDRAAEDRHRVEADHALLDRVREIARAHATRVRQVGPTRIRGPLAHEVSAELRDVPTRDVQIALDLLIDRGDVTVESIAEPGAR